MTERQDNIWMSLLKVGLIAGIAIVYVALVGMAQLFDTRELIRDLLTLGQFIVYAPILFAGYYVTNRLRKESGVTGMMLVNGLVTGLFASLLPILLILLISTFDIRDMFVNASPKLVKLLTLDQGISTGIAIWVGISALLSLIGTILALLPELLRKGVIGGITWTLGIALLSELVIQIIRQLFSNDLIKVFFKGKALLLMPAAGIFVLFTLFTIIWALSKSKVSNSYQGMNSGGQRAVQGTGIIFGLFILLILPGIVGTYLSEVLTFVGLFVLMGLGLNIAVGLAGLLDLGYVTNFAVGAYLMAVLTSNGPLGVDNPYLNFWTVLPLCILAAMCTGFIFALPVLRMRGDYLAIATLGFGEIIRILALSDWFKPYIGGAQGIPMIPKAVFFGIPLNTPERLYYLVLAAAFLTLFVMLRLNNSRTGRQWMAIREDEDAASAMGIDTTIAKVIAFTLSAATGGLAGAIFATKVTAIFPSSMDLLKSINTLSLIIIGGLGSIPGIVIGAITLIGLPELLREFAEYRLLMYGALLIYMMLTRPEGLWPSAVRQRELQTDE